MLSQGVDVANRCPDRWRLAGGSRAGSSREHAHPAVFVRNSPAEAAVRGNDAAMSLELRVEGHPGRELRVRPWRSSDMNALCAEMSLDYPSRGLHPPGPRVASEAEEWLAVQDAGWRDGEWLTFGVLAVDQRGELQVVGQIGLKSREAGRRVAECVVGEVSYWTAVSARGRGIAPAALDAVARWAFDTFEPEGLRELMAVHDVDNPASCRAAEKGGYPFQRVSPPNPPMWTTEGHIHTRRRIGARRLGR